MKLYWIFATMKKIIIGVSSTTLIPTLFSQFYAIKFTYKNKFIFKLGFDKFSAFMSLHSDVYWLYDRFLQWTFLVIVENLYNAQRYQCVLVNFSIKAIRKYKTTHSFLLRQKLYFHKIQKCPFLPKNERSPLLYH